MYLILVAVTVVMVMWMVVVMAMDYCCVISGSHFQIVLKTVETQTHTEQYHCHRPPSKIT